MTVINYNIGANSHSNTGIVHVYNENNGVNTFLVKLLMQMYDEKNKQIESLIVEFNKELSVQKKQLLLDEIKSCHEENKQLTNQLKQPENDNETA